MGGMGGGRSRKAVDTTGLYDVLKVPKSASADEIKKSYRKMAIKLHPDKGGDPEEFKTVQHAFDVLGNEQKRKIYDQYGEEGLENGGGGGGHGDIFDMLSGRRRGGGGHQVKKGEATVHNLKVTLEQAMVGAVRKMKLSRRTIDQASVSTCSSCRGQGVTVRTVRMGPMIQQMQAQCDACGGRGQSYKQSQTSEVLEVHIPKGAFDGHKLKFTEKGDEIPDGEAGDVVFVLQEQPHAVFKRKGDDLFVERTISLSEALCGFAMEITHLDGRKLLIKSKPGDVIAPVSYDPFREESSAKEWVVFEDCDLPGIDGVAEAQTDDVATCKKACSGGQLKGRGIGAFVQRGGRTVFKQCTYDEAMAAKKTSRGSTLYVIQDPSATAGKRLMKAVKGEGLPRLKQPFEHGNLFLILNIEFPTALDAAAVSALKKLLPPSMNVPKSTGTEEDVEVCELENIDPVESAKEAQAYGGGSAMDADDDDEGHGHGHGGGGVQCAQQ